MKRINFHFAVLTLAALPVSLVLAQSTQSAPPATRAPARGAPVAPAGVSPAVMFHIMMSEIALQRGQIGVAYTTYMTLAREWQDARLAQRAFEIAVMARGWEQALEAVRLWARIEPNNEEAQGALRALLIETGRLTDVEAYYAQRIATSENRPLAFEEAQRSLARAPNKAEAWLVLERLSKDLQNMSSVRLALARAALAAQNPVRALQEARAALALDPRSEIAALVTAQLLIRDQPEQATVVLSQYVQANPTAIQARLQLAGLQAAEGKHAVAQALLQDVLVREPTHLDARLALARVQYQARQFESAKRTLDDYLAIAARQNETEVEEALFLQADVAQARQRYSEGIEYLKQVPPGDEFLAAQARIAQLLAKLGDVPGALGLLRAVPTRNPAEARRMTTAQAAVLREAQQYREAFEWLAQALLQDPNTPELLYDYALSAEKVDRLDEMERALKRYIELRPNDAHGYNALGYSWADRNMRLPEALALIQKALTLSPQDPSIIDSLGWVFFRLGRLDEAAQQLQRAYHLYPSAEIAAHLGEVMWVKGERDKAREIWRAGREKDPNDVVLKDTLKRLAPSL